MGAQWRALWPRLLLSRASEAYDRARFVRTMEGRNLAGTRFTAIDPSHWTITRETTKLGEVTRYPDGSYELSPAPGRVFRSDDLDSITAFMRSERDRDAVNLLPPLGTLHRQCAAHEVAA
ncbi:MAG: hypothetical protein ACLPH3_24310 [Terracidiphilus sp.]